MDERRATGRAEVYARLAKLLGAACSLDDVATEMAQAAWRLLGDEGASGASVTVLEDEFLTYVAAVGAASSVAGRIVSLADSFTGDVILGRRAAVFSPAKSYVTASRDRAATAGITCGIVAPIVAAGEVLGTVGVVATMEGTSFSRANVQTLQNLADFIGTGLST